MQEELSEDAGWRERFGAALNRIERLYLKLLRAIVLIVATIMIAIAAWLAASGAYKVSRSPDSVIEAEATVNADDLLNVRAAPEPGPEVATNSGPSGPSAALRNSYQSRLRRYFALYRAKFERFAKPEDKRLSLGEFDDRYLNTEERMKAVGEGQALESQDLADIDRLIALIGEAGENPRTIERLRKYQAARKVDVRKQVERTRVESRRGWDSYSTSCSDWYLSPQGCPTVRTETIPYVENVTVKEYPKGTETPAEIFGLYNDEYWKLLGERRQSNQSTAENQRENIVLGKIVGGGMLMTALQIAAGFLLLMFFFLLIAIERHQRVIARAG